MTTHDRVRLQLQALEGYCVNISTGETMNPSRINLIVPNRSLWTPWNHWSGCSGC
ncbi:Uncharacterised protein [Escherichia coli]|uniref:Uncharacterized protein n=1 Tax=Escherichia coli TaxID=562 RepID=A0A377C3Y6_ECOLX|nr:Uncharacterised protein [Escherichia coli]